MKGCRRCSCLWNTNIGITTLFYSLFQWIFGKVPLDWCWRLCSAVWRCLHDPAPHTSWTFTPPQRLHFTHMQNAGHQHQHEPWFSLWTGFNCVCVCVWPCDPLLLDEFWIRRLGCFSPGTVLLASGFCFIFTWTDWIRNGERRLRLSLWNMTTSSSFLKPFYSLLPDAACCDVVE